MNYTQRLYQKRIVMFSLDIDLNKYDPIQSWTPLSRTYLLVYISRRKQDLP